MYSGTVTWNSSLTAPFLSAMFLNLAVTTAASILSRATISPVVSSLRALIIRTSSPSGPVTFMVSPRGETRSMSVSGRVYSVSGGSLSPAVTPSSVILEIFT